MADMKSDLDKLFADKDARDETLRARAEAQRAADAHAMGRAAVVFASIITPKLTEMAEVLRDRGLAARAEMVTNADGSLKATLYAPLGSDQKNTARATISFSVPSPTSTVAIDYWPKINDLLQSVRLEELSSEAVHSMLLVWYARVVRII